MRGKRQYVGWFVCSFILHFHVCDAGPRDVGLKAEVRHDMCAGDGMLDPARWCGTSVPAASNCVKGFGCGSAGAEMPWAELTPRAAFRSGSDATPASGAGARQSQSCRASIKAGSWFLTHLYLLLIARGGIATICEPSCAGAEAPHAEDGPARQRRA